MTMAQLPAGSPTLAYAHIADATTAQLIPINPKATSVIIKSSADATWVSVDFGDGTVVATKDGSRSSTIAGYPIDEPIPARSTHMSIIAGAAGDVLWLQKRP